jgi:diadenosine tetraphosphate (Ap4A) HIT family hydrolase
MSSPLSATSTPLGAGHPGQPAKRTFFMDVLEDKMPLKPLFESKHSAVVLNIDPCRPGHAMVIPKRPAVLLKDLTATEQQDLFKLMVDYQQYWREAHPELAEHTHFSIFINDGKYAGQSVPHVHIHVVPVTADKPVAVGSLRHALKPNAFKGKPSSAEYRRMLKEVNSVIKHAELHSFTHKKGYTPKFNQQI